MKNYYRIILGQGSKHAEECYKGGFVGIDYGIKINLTGKLPENWKEFNKEFIPIYLSSHPGKTKVAAGLACGFTWNLTKGIKKGDVFISPDGGGNYYVGEVIEDYSYHPGEILPHRRRVQWYPKTISRADMSQEMKYSTGSTGAVTNLAGYAKELEELIAGNHPPVITTTDGTIEDPSTFALEKHLEDFLVQNWRQSELGKNYDIYEVDGEIVGKQFQSDTGPIDILAVSKDKKELLVVELKKGRASDSVVGQIQRYMGYVLEELAEESQTVKGIIIAQDDDLKIQRALKVTTNIEFYRYQVSFKLLKA